ncbi:hypothetical protein E1B28_003789 [Marasmius oreades]|uniref:Yeast cell wall synthesis Kre9/Knh1-like N-terminal domain-containing protein n=1 Tax=Marasmius oreades TaxID=181124 RepID=A0A9P8AC35_9AGAR|nr:uncharacterized protein E1B28_003789 [Marasmius oreades]KAG7096345.1 hypothetical protein E1B28_003789 [Marasmius oreades]
MRTGNHDGRRLLSENNKSRLDWLFTRQPEFLSPSFVDMFSLKSLTTLAFASYAVALISISGPSNAVVGADSNIAWASNPNDPATFTLFLLNADNLPFGLVHNYEDFQTSAGKATISFPSTLDTNLNYVFRAVNSSSVDFVYSSSGVFRLGPARA